jgi:5-methyltetrahydropteroyltriglutamate--homocysteine methyltransferase
LQLEAYQHGIYPRSERLVAATRDLDRGRTDRTSVDGEFRRDLDRFVESQHEAGLDYLSDGMLRWQDLFRPFVDASEGMSPGPLTRWFDTNSFFRAPVVTGPPAIDPAAVTFEDLGGGPGRVVSLPSPFAFSRAAHFDGERDALMLDLARDVLAPVAAEAVRKGAAVLHLEDPWLAFYGIEEGAWSALAKSIDELRSGLGATVVFHTYFGDVTRYMERVQWLPVDAVGIDLFASDAGAIEVQGGMGVLLGCFDGRSSVVERADDLVPVISRLLDRLEPPACFLSSSSDLQLVSEELARRKVAALGEVAAALKKEVS